MQQLKVGQRAYSPPKLPDKHVFSVYLDIQYLRSEEQKIGMARVMTLMSALCT